MAHIDIKCPICIKEDLKYDCANEIAEVVSRLFHIKKGDISVAIKEVIKTNWKSEVYEKYIKPDSNYLYKSPSYNYTIEFEYYNPVNEKRSCVPVALSKMTGRNYEEIKQELEELTDEMGLDHYSNPVVFEAYMEKIGIDKFADVSNVRVRELTLESGVYCVYCTNGLGENYLVPVINNIMYGTIPYYMEMDVISIYRLKMA